MREQGESKDGKAILVRIRGGSIVSVRKFRSKSQLRSEVAVTDVCCSSHEYM